jgi:hypothetical protein
LLGLAPQLVFGRRLVRFLAVVAVLACADDGGVDPLLLLGVGGFGDDAQAGEFGFEFGVGGGSSSAADLVHRTRVAGFIGAGQTVISNTSSWTMRRPPHARFCAPPSGTR